MKRYLLLLAFLASPAFSQTQPWDSNVLTWVAPTQCSTGEAITACPVTGYRIETATSSTGTFTTLTTVPATALTFTQTGVTAGVHCYRLWSLSAVGDSPTPSNIACKTNVKPVGPPNPPVLTVASNLAMTVLKTAHGWDLVDNVGLAKMGAECDPAQSFGHGYYALKHPRTDVVYYAGQRARDRIAALCA